MENNNQTANYDTTTSDESRFIDKHRSNVKSDLIEITEDKLENILLKHIRKIGTRKAWLAPLGLFISIILANISATFTEKFGIPSSIWEAIFFIGAIASGIWLIASFVLMIVNWKESSIDYLISRIKNSEN